MDDVWVYHLYLLLRMDDVWVYHLYLLLNFTYIYKAFLWEIEILISLGIYLQSFRGVLPFEQWTGCWLKEKRYKKKGTGETAKNSDWPIAWSWKESTAIWWFPAAWLVDWWSCSLMHINYYCNYRVCCQYIDICCQYIDSCYQYIDRVSRFGLVVRR